MIQSDKNRRSSAWVDEVDDLIRGAAGGFLFGIPLLYTMEVWWIGSFAQPIRLILAIILTFTIVFMLNRTDGFRKSSETQSMDAMTDSVEAMAIGIVCCGLILVLLQEITLQTALNEALGKLIYESMPFTLGVALANQFLGGEDQQSHRNGDKQVSLEQDQLNATLADIGATLIGAMVIASSIAPTDEVPMLVAAVSGLWLLAIMLISLLISYAIVFQAGFANQSKRQQQKGIFQRPLSETIISYLVSLFAAAVMLVFFSQLHLDDPWQMWLSYSIILGLPAAIGGAAGRLAI